MQWRRCLYLFQRLSAKLLRSSGHYLRLTTRNFHAQAITQSTRWRRPKEERKVAIHRDRRVAILHSLLHVCPATAALVFLIFNIKGRHIGGVSTTTITAMQFAAKALEISMQASLTAILLSLIRHQALSTCTVPLGSFVAPVNTTKISYLWSLELWGPLTSRHLPAWRKIALFSAILVAVLLAAVVGPSSAVLMIPRPIKYHTRDFLVLLDDNATLFPTRIGPTSGSLS